MTLYLKISMWKSVRLACPQAGWQSDKLSVPISCSSSVIQQLDADPEGQKKRERQRNKSWIFGYRLGLALCQSLLIQSSIWTSHRPTTCQDDSDRMTKRQEVTGKQVNRSPDLAGKLSHLPFGPCWLLQITESLIHSLILHQCHHDTFWG